MKRIQVMNNYWSSFPSKNNFREYDAQVLITKMLTMYTLGNDGEVKMLHPFQLMDVIVDEQVSNDFKQAMLDLVNKLSDKDWQKVCESLNIDKGNVDA